MQVANSPLSVFNFHENSLRVVHVNGDPWFVASDVLEALTLDRKALERLDEDEKGVSSIHTPGGPQEMTTVNEPGLYGLVLGSRKPEAKRFKRWVTSEVLPAIRKTGRYQIQESLPLGDTLQDRLVEKFPDRVKRAAAEAKVLERFGAEALNEIAGANIPKAMAFIDTLSAREEARAIASRENGRKGGRPPKSNHGAPSLPAPAAARQDNKFNGPRKRLSFVGVSTKKEIEPWVVNNMRTNDLMTDLDIGDKLFAEIATLAVENETEAFGAMHFAVSAHNSQWAQDGFVELGFSRAMAAAAIIGLRAIRNGAKPFGI